MIKFYQCDIFPFNVAIGDTPDEFMEKFTTLEGGTLAPFDEDVSRRGLAFTANHNGYRWDCILLGSESTVGTWAHESFHIAQAMLEFVGVLFHRGESNETYAYVIGWLVELIYQFINERDNEKE